MKFFRHGPSGSEKPGVLDRQGGMRDLSGLVDDIDGAVLERGPDLGLGAIDVLILLPILLSIAGTLFAFAIVGVVLFGVGGFLFAIGPIVGAGADIGAVMLAGLGVMAGGTSLGALTALATIGFVNALVWYGRLHMRLLKPALEPVEARS